MHASLSALPLGNMPVDRHIRRFGRRQQTNLLAWFCLGNQKTLHRDSGLTLVEIP